MRKNIPVYYSLPAVIISTLLLAVAVNAWTEPTTAPPGPPNVATPINVGGDTQLKTGALGINGIFYGNSDGVFSGGVSIGTEALPTQKLDVAGNIKLPTNSFIQGNTTGISGNGGYISFTGEAASNASYGIWQSNNAYWNGTNWIKPRGSLGAYLTGISNNLAWSWRYASTSSGVDNSVITPTEVVKITSTGNLEIAGTIKIAGGTPGIGKVLTSDAAGLASWTTPSGGLSGSGTQNYISKFNNAGGTSLGNSQIFDNGTSVGIGTTNPGSKLHVTSGNLIDSPTGDIILSRYWASSADTRASAIFHYYDTPTTRDMLVIGVSGSGAGSMATPNQISQARMVIRADGNVGIGTTNPGTNKLQVNGKIQAVGGDICTDQGGGKCLSTVGGGISGSGTANKISKWTGASALGDSLITDNGTNIGIDDTTPAGGRLDIYGATADSLINLQRSGTAAQYSLNVGTDGKMVIKNQGGTAILTVDNPTSDVSIAAGKLDLNNKTIVNVATPANNNDAANKAYVDAAGGKPIWKGYTPSTYLGGGVGGFSGANAKCNTAYSGSHACTYDEVLRLGISFPATQSAWIIDGSYSTGTYQISESGFGYDNSHNPLQPMCNGWTMGDGSHMGPYQYGGTPWISLQTCDYSYYLPCCQ